MKKHVIYILLFAISFFLMAACKVNCEIEESRTIIVNAFFSEDGTRAVIEQAQGTLDLVTRWKEDDRIRLYLFQDGQGFTLDPVPVYNISSDGKRCYFGFKLPSDISLDHPYEIYGLCDAEGVPQNEEALVVAKSQLKRMQWNDRIVPMWFHATGGQSSIQANFRHLGTYEILHVTNTSKVGVMFRHDGFDVEVPWYKSYENTPLKDDYDPTQYVQEPGDDAHSGSAFIPANSTRKYLSWYIPTGATINDARLLATIEGKSVSSVNTKSSSVRIQRGHVYHMYATWDGNELKFDDHGAPSGALEIETPEIDFGDVVVISRARDYLVIRNNGDEEQKVKVEIDNYTYDSPFELDGADLGDSFVYKIIPAGESRGFALSFRPPSLGEFSGNLIITPESQSGWKAVVPMLGKGVEEQVDNSFHLSENSIEVYLRDNRSVEIHNGSGEYDVVNENPDIVEWDINGIHVAHAPTTRSDGTTGRPSSYDSWYITGKKLGDATLRLTDKQTNEELILHAKVINAPSLVLESTDVTMNVDEEKRVKILSGSAWYQVSSDDESIVKASKASMGSGGSGGLYGDDRPNSGIYVMLNALSAGQTTVRVKDMSSYEEAEIQVVVRGVDENCIIRYTSLDGSIVSPYNINVFGASIVSNKYENGYGEIIFDGPVSLVGDNAFYGCDNLLSMILPNSVISIGKSAFCLCSNLEHIEMSDCVSFIGEDAFWSCSNLTEFRIPSSVTTLNYGVFGYCEKLSNTTIPEGITTIMNGAFRGCEAFTSIVIPSSVSFIDCNVFILCPKLESIIVSQNNQTYDSHNNCNAIIETKKNALIAGCKNTIIPAGTTAIGPGAFCGTTGFSSIEIPNSVSSIGFWAFGRCTGLQSIVIPEGVRIISDSCFEDCTNLTSVIIPKSVESIEHNAFEDCCSLVDITIPEIVSHIGYTAFRGCSSLKQITIPGSVSIIESFCFADCTNLTDVIIQNGVTKIEGSAFSDCAFESIVIPASVKAIEIRAFEDCINLSSLSFSEGIESIGVQAFSGCRVLTSVVLPKSLTSIGKEAFFSPLLTNVTALSTTPPSGGENMFWNWNPDALSIYVPFGSVEAYKKADYWSVYADKIKAIPE